VMVPDTDAEVYEKHAEELLRFATVLVGPNSAADILSAAVLSAIGSPSWSDVINRRAYLFRCVLNEARSSLRSKVRRESLEQRLAQGEVVELPQRDLDIISALFSLTPRQRSVIYLAYWEDQPAAQIARLLGISLGSVHRHLARARAHLRRLLND
jgi:RNA polymerase sigma factor (sigma-70 family)